MMRRPRELIELRKANVESAQHCQNQNCEGDDLRAGIDFADQLAGELPQKYFGVVAARRRRSFHRGLFDERRNVRIAAPGHERGAGPQSEKKCIDGPEGPIQISSPS